MLRSKDGSETGPVRGSSEEDHDTDESLIGTKGGLKRMLKNMEALKNLRVVGGGHRLNNLISFMASKSAKGGSSKHHGLDGISHDIDDQSGPPNLSVGHGETDEAQQSER